MSKIKVAILGFGTVGEGVYKTITTHQDKLTSALGKQVVVAGILVKNKNKDRGISKEVLVTENFEDILELGDIDIVIEAIVGREPAYTYLRRSIENGCHVITANKEMFAYDGAYLKKLAAENGVSIGFEATVAGGVPVIQTIQQLLSINRITKIEGILNGTSNYILSEMRTKGQSFAEALNAAQQKGYAEADPTNDVEGFDAFYKLMILSEIAFGGRPDWESVPREGISAITGTDIKQAEKLGLRFKLIASIQQSKGKMIGSVRPTLVPESHPLFNIEGVENSVSIEGDIVGQIALQGPGAGMLPTASAIIEDIKHVVHGTKTNTIEPFSSNTFEGGESFKKQNWLMINPKKEQLDHAQILDAIEYKNHLFLKADEPTVLKLRNRGARFFEVLGDFEGANVQKI